MSATLATSEPQARLQEFEYHTFDVVKHPAPRPEDEFSCPVGISKQGKSVMSPAAARIAQLAARAHIAALEKMVPGQRSAAEHKVVLASGFEGVEEWKERAHSLLYCSLFRCHSSPPERALRVISASTAADLCFIYLKFDFLLSFF